MQNKKKWLSPPPTHKYTIRLLRKISCSIIINEWYVNTHTHTNDMTWHDIFIFFHSFSLSIFVCLFQHWYVMYTFGSIWFGFQEKKENKTIQCFNGNFLICNIFDEKWKIDRVREREKLSSLKLNCVCVSVEWWQRFRSFDNSLVCVFRDSIH